MKNMWLLRVCLAWGWRKLGLACQAAETLRFEAEDCVVNRDAVLADKFAPNRWTLWTKDVDAQRKWSGGAVLRSPEVKADRAMPEDGAPPLHLVLKNIPQGTYDLQVKRGRALAVSLDGKQWRRLEGDVVARDLQIDHGTFEFWVDDRFAEEKPEHRGASYLDYIVLEPSAPLVRESGTATSRRWSTASRWAGLCRPLRTAWRSAWSRGRLIRGNMRCASWSNPATARDGIASAGRLCR